MNNEKIQQLEAEEILARLKYCDYDDLIHDDDCFSAFDTYIGSIDDKNDFLDMLTARRVGSEVKYVLDPLNVSGRKIFLSLPEALQYYKQCREEYEHRRKIVKEQLNKRLIELAHR